MKQRPRHVHQMCHSSKGDLARIIKAAAALKQFDKRLKQLLPKVLSEHCQVVNYQQNQLLIAVDSGQWASRFRLIRTDLLTKLRKYPEFAALSAVDCKVMPTRQQNIDSIQPDKPRNFLLNRDNSMALQQMVEDCQNEKLKQKLLKFLQHYGSDSRQL